MTKETTVEEFKGDHFTVKLTKEPNCKVSLEVDIQPKACEAAKEKAIKKVKKGVSIPGFRKGKVPTNIITEQYKPQLEQEWDHILTNTGLNDALILVNLSPIVVKGKRHVEIDLKKEEDHAHLTAKFEISPTVPSIDLTHLQITEQFPQEIKKEQLEDHIEQLKLQHAEWKEVEERSVEEGDFVDLDLTLIKEGEDNVPLGENRRFFIKKGKVENWLYDLIVGQSLGITIEGVRDPAQEDQNDGSEEPQTIEVTLRTILQAIPPELDEAFLEKLNCETAEELKEKIQEHLASKEKEEIQKNYRQQMELQLLGSFPFEIPQSLLEEEVKGRLSAYREEFASAKLDEERKKELEKELEQTARKTSKDAICLYYLIGKFIGESNIEVAEDELTREVFSKAMLSNPDLLRNEEEYLEARDQIRNDLLIQKALDTLTETVLSGKKTTSQ